MNFLSRAWSFTKAKKGRTGMLILVFTAILVFVMAGLTIQNATQTASRNAKKEVGATVTLSVNREKMMQKLNPQDESGQEVDRSKIDIPTLKASDVESIASMDEVKSAVLSSSATAEETNKFKAMKSEENTSNDSETNQGFGGGRMPANAVGQNMANADFRITGVNDMSAVSTFADGTDKITDGRAINEEDKNTNHAVIEETIAKLNDLKVGDTFKIKNTDGKEVSLEIVGIYTSGQETNEMSMRIASMNPVNTFYTYYTEANTIAGSDKDTVSNAVFNLKNPEEMDTFVKEAEKKIDTDQFQLQTNDALYQQMLSPLNNVASFSKNIVLLVAIAGAIILTLIVVLQIRERKFEIGVLISMGENKFKVIGQFFAELVIVMLVSAGLAGVLGNFVGNAVGQQLLTQQNETTEQASINNQAQGREGMQRGGGMRNFGFGQSQKEIEQIKELNVKTTPQTFGILVAIALGITILAILLASIGILRMQPKSILTSN